MRDFSGLLTKYAGPSPRDRAAAGVPGSRPVKAIVSSATPMGSLAQQKAYVRQQGRSALAKQTPEQQAKFWDDASKYQRAAMAGRAAVGAVATAPYWGPVAIKYAPRIFKAWAKPSSVGPVYSKALRAVQTFGAPALLTLPPQYLEKIPEPIRDIPAYASLLSPAGLAKGLAYRAVGEAAARSPKAAEGGGAAVANVGINMAENAAQGRVKFVPDVMGWSPSARKNFQAGVEHGVNSRINATQKDVMGKAREAYDTGMSEANAHTDGLASRIFPFDPIERNIRDFYGKSLREKAEHVKRLPMDMQEYAQASVGRVAENLPESVQTALSKVTPEERDAILAFLIGAHHAAPVMRDNLRDIRQLVGTNDVDRAALAGGIARRTIPLMVGNQY